MSAREELLGKLANTICNVSLYPGRAQPYLLGGDMNNVLAGTADALIDAGYSKPRTITTVEELDALPVGSLVREDDGFSRYKYATGWALCVPDATAQESGDKLVLPATVLFEPAA